MIAHTAQKTTEKPTYFTGFGLLRSFIIILVVIHHSILAYHPDYVLRTTTFAEIPDPDFMSPIVDTASWGGIRAMVFFFDSFFMSLMFLVSGLFVWQSLQRKGTKIFLQQRLLRLGIPFLVMALILAPITFYATYLQTTTTPSLGDYWQQMLARGDILSKGPGWFVWVLLFFDILVIWIPPKLLEPLRGISPVKFFGGLIILSMITYFPLAYIYGPNQWTTVAIFSFQSSRIFHYFLYFLMGIGLGMHGINDGFLKQDGDFARQWPLWTVAMIAVFIYAFIITFSDVPLWSLLNAIGIVVFCALACAAFLAVFLRFGTMQSPLLSNFDSNSFGIYIVHYGIVIWMQYALLPVTLPPIIKASIVIVSTLILSWGIIALLRRNATVAKVI